MAYNGVTVKHIVATDLNGCIGKDGKMPWHIPADLKRFRELTEGGVVIMGRKTFESLGCKPLPNRRNIVVSHNFDYYNKHKDCGATIFGSMQSALRAAWYVATANNTPIWIIGGAEIYAQTMQYVDEVEHTVVDMKVEGGDAFYPDIREDFDAIDAVELDGVYYYTLHRRYYD